MANLTAMVSTYNSSLTVVNRIEQKMEVVVNQIYHAAEATDKFKNKLETVGADTSSISQGFKNLASSIDFVDVAIKGMNIADEFTNTSKKLGLITDGLKEQEELQDKIFAAANRSRGDYGSMAGNVAGMMLPEGNSFTNNDEAIDFVELLQKSFKVSGTDSSTQSDVMTQLTQAMSTGGLQGDDFTSIMNNAPMVANAIADYTGKNIDKLKEMSSQGLITSEIIKNAMFAAGNDINDQFADMPTTFADIWKRIKDGALQAFAPIMEAVSNLINSNAFLSIVGGIITVISFLGSAIDGVINFIIGNWPLIQSILMAIGVFLTIYAINLATQLLPGLILTGLMGLQSGLMIAAGWVAANLPMLLLIATLALVIYGFIQAGVTVQDVFSFIGGFIGVVIAGIINLFLGFGELVLGIINALYAPWVWFCNFMANVFTSPISSIIYLFHGLGDSALGVLESIASAMDFVFGSNMADTVAGWRAGLKEMADDAVAEYAPNENYQKKVDFEYSLKDFGVEGVNYKDAYDAGDKLGKGAYDNLVNLTNSLIAPDSTTLPENVNNLTDSLTDTNSLDTSLNDLGTTSNPMNVKGTGSNGTMEVDMADEDLQYLRDIAERDYINQFSSATLAPNISVQFGDVHETADADAVAGRIRKILQEEISMTAEGAY